MKPHLLFTFLSLFVASALFAQSDLQPWIGTWKVVSVDTKETRENLKQWLSTLSDDEAELNRMGYEMLEEEILTNVSKMYLTLNADGTYKAYIPNCIGIAEEDNGTYKMNFPFVLELKSKNKDENATTQYAIINATPTDLILREESFKFVITLQLL